MTYYVYINSNSSEYYISIYHFQFDNGIRNKVHQTIHHGIEIKQLIETKDINVSVNKVDEEYNNISRFDEGSNHIKILNTLQTNGDNTSYGGYNSNNQLIRTSFTYSENDTSNNNNKDINEGINRNSQMESDEGSNQVNVLPPQKKMTYSYSLKSKQM